MRRAGVVVAVLLVGASCSSDGSGADGSGESAEVAAAADALGSEEPAATSSVGAVESDGDSRVAQLAEWSGVELTGLGNGAVNGRFPTLVIERVDVERNAVWLSGNDGCNTWSTSATVVDGLVVFDDRRTTMVDCGPGTFGPRAGDELVVGDDGLDVVRDGRVFSFGPGASVVDASVLMDGRRFVEVSTRGSFPASLAFDGATMTGFDGCGDVDGTVEYGSTGVELVDVDASCETGTGLEPGDVVEHVGANTVEVRRDGEVVIRQIVAIEESFVPPTTEWLIGDWLLGWGRVTFDEGTVTVGRCETTWEEADGVIEVEPWGDCLTGLFPGDATAEQLLVDVVGSQLVHRQLPPVFDDELSEWASVLDAGDRSVRLVRYETPPPSSPDRLFALESIDGTPFGGAVVPALVWSGAGQRWFRGYDGCLDISGSGTVEGSSVVVEQLSRVSGCAAPEGPGFAPALGTSITVDGDMLTAVDAAGRVGVFRDITDLDRAFVADFLDPVTGTAVWQVDGLTVEVTGPPDVGVIRAASCERSWSFDPEDSDPTNLLGALRVGGESAPLMECAGADATQEAFGFLELLRRTTKGDGASVLLAPDGTTYLTFDALVIRIDPT